MAESYIGLRFTNISYLIRAIYAFLAFQFLLQILFFCFLSTRIDKLITWDFKIVFIPLWIQDGSGLVKDLILIAVTLYDDKYDYGDMKEQLMGAERVK